ncbi:unnamed protein product [Effrenium voratum]|nr:unnamed protein product [Effrenium voratum]
MGAEDDGPDFVGTNYTTNAVKKLIKLAKEDPSPIDLLLTAEWPRGMEERVEEAERPKDPDGRGLVSRDPWDPVDRIEQGMGSTG